MGGQDRQLYLNNKIKHEKGNNQCMVSYGLCHVSVDMRSLIFVH